MKQLYWFMCWHNQTESKKDGPRTKNYSPSALVTLNLVSLLSCMYPFLAFSDAHLPCLDIKRSDTPFCAAAEAPPDRKLCKP